MQEFGGPESFTPGEGAVAGGEKLSEQAKERFAQAAAQIKQILREEKRARKRDDRVAQTILQFLGEDKYAHLFQLIAHLAARDCPSVFILAILSLIHGGSLEAVDEYIAEHKVSIKAPTESDAVHTQHLPQDVQHILLLWITRLQLVLTIDAEKILPKLMVDEGNIDGTVLQLTTFVLVDYFESIERPVPFEKLQPLTVKILQDVIEPHFGVIEKHFTMLRAGEKSDEQE
jgi:hypothetical protein